jgi:glutaminase
MSQHDDEIDRALQDTQSASLSLRDGEVPDHVPLPAGGAADDFGIALATIGGQMHSVGVVEQPFAIQSISKALCFCMALDQAGREAVLSRVGLEPSGDAFNGIEFHGDTQRPHNPMVNAGAIAISGMLRDAWGNGAFAAIRDRFSRAAGRPLGFHEAIFEAEAATGHRNHAIAHLLLSVGALEAPVDPAVELYFRQCAILVTTTDLARIGTTLAHGGKSPWTGEQVFSRAAVRDTLSVMMTCGMYDASGFWSYDVGMPAKSGVGGGILGVVAGRLAVATYSPRLDPKGNSVRGVAAFGQLSDELGLHVFGRAVPLPA